MVFLLYDAIDEATESNVDLLLKQVSEQRREYASQFQNIFPKWLCLQSFQCLAMCDPYTFNKSTRWHISDKGKPLLNDVFFSISHCKKGVAVALHDHIIGIDIEWISRLGNVTNSSTWMNKNLSLIEKTMNEEEISEIRHSDKPHIKFFTFWTKKEAVVKCIGTGITNDFKYVLSFKDNKYDSLIIRTLPFPQKDYIVSFAYKM